MSSLLPHAHLEIYLDWIQSSSQNNLEYWRIYFFERGAKTPSEAFLLSLLSTGFGKSLIYQQFSLTVLSYC